MQLMAAGVGLGTLLLFGAAVRADDFPPRKPGLWQIEMAMQGRQMPAQKMTMCIDATTDAELYKLGLNASQGMCDKPAIARSGSTVTVDAVCRIGESRTATHSVTVYSGDTAYHTDASTKIDPPIGGHGDSAMMQDAKWVGSCPADMQPGDMSMGNGMKMNVKQMLSGKP
jgi:hypothetical protein